MAEHIGSDMVNLHDKEFVVSTDNLEFKGPQLIRVSEVVPHVVLVHGTIMSELGKPEERQLEVNAEDIDDLLKKVQVKP
jgi:hypothetical protein